jgi:hypothetical protein
MKKLFVFLAVAAFMLSTGCKNSTTQTPTPSSIEKTLYDQIQKGDHEQAMTVLFDNLDTDEEERIEKEEFIAEFSQKSRESYEAQGGLKSYEIIAEEISENGDTARVQTKMIYGDGTADTNSTEYIRKHDGTWKISLFGK